MARIGARGTRIPGLLPVSSPPPDAVAQTIQVFDCAQLPDGTRELEAAPEIKCWEGEHLQLVALGALSGIGAFLRLPVPEAATS